MSQQEKPKELVNKTYEFLNIVGGSNISVEEAMSNAVKKASKIQPNVSWFEFVKMTGAINKGEIIEYQVELKVGYQSD
ncbi:MAG: dodecin family protein [Nitrososphaeraceae archaeon]